MSGRYEQQKHIEPESQEARGQDDSYERQEDARPRLSCLLGVAQLREIPGERIQILQFNDAPATAGADLLEEAMLARRLPGTGDIDLVGLVRVLEEIGATPLLALWAPNRTAAPCAGGIES